MINIEHYTEPQEYGIHDNLYRRITLINDTVYRFETSLHSYFTDDYLMNVYQRLENEINGLVYAMDLFNTHTVDREDPTEYLEEHIESLDRYTRTEDTDVVMHTYSDDLIEMACLMKMVRGVDEHGSPNDILYV